MADDLVVQTHLNKLRKDKFVMILNIPNILRGLNLRGVVDDKHFNLDSMQFSLYNATIPPVSIPKIPLAFGGQSVNITSFTRSAYDPVTINFEVDNEFKNYWLLWKWLELFNDPTESTYGDKEVFPNGYPDVKPNTKFDYHTEIVIMPLDEYNNPVVKFRFKYAFPTNLGALDLDQRADDQLATSFTFEFSQMKVEYIEKE